MCAFVNVRRGPVADLSRGFLENSNGNGHAPRAVLLLQICCVTVPGALQLRGMAGLATGQQCDHYVWCHAERATTMGSTRALTIELPVPVPQDTHRRATAGREAASASKGGGRRHMQRFRAVSWQLTGRGSGLGPTERGAARWIQPVHTIPSPPHTRETRGIAPQCKPSHTHLDTYMCQLPPQPAPYIAGRHNDGPSTRGPSS